MESTPAVTLEERLEGVLDWVQSGRSVEGEARGARRSALS